MTEELDKKNHTEVEACCLRHTFQSIKRQGEELQGENSWPMHRATSRNRSTQQSSSTDELRKELTTLHCASLLAAATASHLISESFSQNYSIDNHHHQTHQNPLPSTFSKTNRPRCPTARNVLPSPSSLSLVKAPMPPEKFPRLCIAKCMHGLILMMLLTIVTHHSWYVYSQRRPLKHTPNCARKKRIDLFIAERDGQTQLRGGTVNRREPWVEGSSGWVRPTRMKPEETMTT